MDDTSQEQAHTSNADARLELTDEALRRPMTPDEREALFERERARLADPEYRRVLERADGGVDEGVGAAPATVTTRA